MKAVCSEGAEIVFRVLFGSDYEGIIDPRVARAGKRQVRTIRSLFLIEAKLFHSGFDSLRKRFDWLCLEACPEDARRPVAGKEADTTDGNGKRFEGHSRERGLNFLDPFVGYLTDKFE